MHEDGSNVEVKDNAAEERYEAEIDGQIAVIEYERARDGIIFLHTEVPAALEGHGIAGRMAHVALEDARARGLAVIPLCPFVASYMRRHPEYQALVPPDFQSRVTEK
jgi:predicted GNAT family acetyltransferase